MYGDHAVQLKQEQLTAMRKSMRELSGWVKNWSDMSDEIKRANELVPSSVEGFTPARKQELELCLQNAYAHLFAPGSAALIQEKIEERLDLVRASEAYVVEATELSPRGMPIVPGGVHNAQMDVWLGDLRGLSCD